MKRTRREGRKIRSSCNTDISPPLLFLADAKRGSARLSSAVFSLRIAEPRGGANRARNKDGVDSGWIKKELDIARGGRRMSGDGVANLEKPAKARRLRVTAVIPPQYNPIRPRLRPPLVEPRRFHSSASTLSPPPSPPSQLRPRCSFQRSFPLEPLVSPSFRRCAAAYNEWCTPSTRRYASALFSFPASLFSPRLLSPPPPPSPAVALSYSVFYFFPRRSPSCRASLISPFFLVSAISYSAPWE